MDELNDHDHTAPAPGRSAPGASASHGQSFGAPASYTAGARKVSDSDKSQGNGRASRGRASTPPRRSSREHPSSTPDSPATSRRRFGEHAAASSESSTGVDPWREAIESGQDLGDPEGPIRYSRSPRRGAALRVTTVNPSTHARFTDQARAQELDGVWEIWQAEARLAARRYETIASSWRDLEDCDLDEAAAELLAVATATRMTRTQAERRINDAHRAVTFLPDILSRLRDGRMPADWFERVLARTRNLTESQLAEVNDEIATWRLNVSAEAFHRRLGHLLARLENTRTATDPVPAVPRSVDLLRPTDDGTACLQVTGPAPEVLDLARRLDVTARTAQAAQRAALEHGDPIPCDPGQTVTETATPASLGRLRYQLLQDAVFDPEGVSVPEQRFRLNVTVPVMTLLGVSDEPGNIEGTTPLPADMARTLAGESAVWHRVLTDPATGTFLPLPATRYAPSQAMLEHLRLRGGDRCAAPGCTRPVSWAAETDHIDEYHRQDPDTGGLTEIENLHLLCWAHHRAKTAGHLDPVRDPHSRNGPGGTTWMLNQKVTTRTLDETDLATPATVKAFTTAWNHHQAREEEQQRERERERVSRVK